MIYLLFTVAIFSHYVKGGYFHSVNLPPFVIYLPLVYLVISFVYYVIISKRISFSLSVEDRYLLPFMVILIGSIYNFNQFQIVVYIVVIYFIFLRIYVPKASDLNYLRLSVYLSIILNFWGILSSDFDYRASGLFNNPNIFGFYCAVLFLLATHLESKDKYLIIIISLVFVYLSGSRTSMLAMLVVFFMNIKIRTMIVIASIVFFSLALNGLDEVKNIVRFSSDLSKLSSGRTDILFEMIEHKKADSIYLPSNLGVFEKLAGTQNFHNGYLRIFIASGIIFLILYMIVILFTIIYFYIKGKGSELLVVYSMIFYMMSLFEDYQFSINGYSFYITLVVLMFSKYQRVFCNENSARKVSV